MKVSVIILNVLWIAGDICLVQSECNLGPIGKHSIKASSETASHPASGIFTDEGWCADSSQNNKWIDVDFAKSFGVKSFTLSPSNIDGSSFPTKVLVQYKLQEGTNLSNIQLQNGPLVLQLNKTTVNSTINLTSGFAAKQLRFTLEEFSGQPCMKLRIAGCELEDLCQPACQNGGLCVVENRCVCMGGFQGEFCEITPCLPDILGVYDGRIPQKDIIVSSQDTQYPKSQLGLNVSNTFANQGWCAAYYDKSPWIEIKLDEPKSLSSFYFGYINKQGQRAYDFDRYMETFDLQYIAPTDSSRIFLTFADKIPSLNGTHMLKVTIYPSIVTDTLRIVSNSQKGRTCFKFELAGCDPKGFCQSGWCLNGGSCVGKNICKCPSGYIGNRCDKNSTDISTPRITFLNITNDKLFTTLFTFNVFGQVTIQIVNKTNVVAIKGTDSNIKLDKNIAGSECLTNLDRCPNGFTLSIDVNFGSLVDNTYIVSNGGDKPDHTGLALFYAHQTLTYVVTTSTQTWKITVSYTPVLNKWQKFEITWNSNLGIGLFLNGNLLATHSRPDPITATQTAQLCIGCSPGQSSNVMVDMQILQLHLWSVSRTELVNAGIVQAPIVTTRRPLQTTPSTTQKPTTPKPTTPKPTTPKPTTPKPTTTATTTMITSTLKTTLSTTPGRGYEVFNMTITGLVGNILITPAFNFTVYGNPKLELENNSNTALILDCSKHQYVELADKSIPCLQDLDKCSKGFTFNMEIKFSKIESTEKTYILSSGGDEATHNGMAVYLHSNLLTYGVKKGRFHWAASTSVQNVLTVNNWYMFEISWSETNGLQVLIDGFQILKSSDFTPAPGAPRTNPVLIGKSPNNPYTSCMAVRNLYTWTIERETLVTNGILQAAKSTTTSTTTTSTPKPTTTIPTTTPQPIPTFHWNLTTVPVSNVIIGQIFNLTIHGYPTKTSSGIEFKNTTQYMEFGQIKCLLDPTNCVKGLTIQFKINAKVTSENTYLLTSGGELPNGIGIAVIYRYGQYQFVLTTTTKSWYANCGKDILTPNKFHIVMLTWKDNIGLEIIVDNKQVELVTTTVSHEVSMTTSASVFFGKQPATTLKYEYILQTVSIWYAHVDLLVIEGLCPKPERPEKPKPNTTPAPKTTPKPTTSAASSLTGIISTKPPQCPVGCISVDKTTAKPVVTATSKPPVTDKPSQSTKQTPPSTRQTQPSTKQTTPTTTERGAPNYSTSLTITATVDKTDSSAYLVCAFRKTDEAGIEMTVALIIENTRVLVTTVAGTVGIAMFSVAKVNRDLYGKKIHCSLVANYIGSSHSTHVFISNTYVPKFTVTPTKITVTEGLEGKYVTVQSTAPPHLYCCTGCKGQCQIHVVGTFIYNRKDTKCSYNYISQAVIESHKPPNYNKDICGFTLTNTNWKNENTILVVATLDNRRDGTQKRELKVIVNVYNQPPTVQITDRPITHTLRPYVEVTIKDNYHSPYTCKSINDPHMLTFDGSHYNNMNEGQFVMFKHKELPFEVRTWYHMCSKRSHATCNCGVAIKSGDDVISVIGCHTITSGGHHGHGHGIGLIFQQLFGHVSSKDEFAKTPMTIQIYKNGELTPGTYIRRYGCGQKYEIQLPTGMIITVQQSYKPFINVWIKASSYDWNKSSGLCGNFNGKRDEWKNSASLTTFIKNNIAPNGPFFNGVGASTLTTGSLFCSCVENKGSVCSPGLGVMQCTKSRYDITQALIRQSKSPILTSSRQKRQVQTTEDPQTIIQDNTTMSLDEARDECYEVITNNSVTISCQPLLTNLTQQIENCAYDYQAMGNFAFASSTLSDIVADCVDTANELIANNDTETNDTTVIDIPDNLDAILDNACLENCGQNGVCREGVCECKEGYTGDRCEISQNTKPTISSIPVLCDIVNTLDCTGAVVYGNNFVNSSALTCHFEYIEVTDSIAETGQSGTIPATFISINQVVCQIPQLMSTQIRISNNGKTLSDASSPHVVYDSGCFDCSIRNETIYVPYCNRKPNNCVINGRCYQPGSNKQGDVCSICSPAVNNSEWSLNREKVECTVQSVALTSTKNKDDENKIIALAVVSAVLAAILLLLICYIVRSRSTSRSKKEFGEYEVTPENKLHREDPHTILNNPIYSKESAKL